jgi:hypothetical protein
MISLAKKFARSVLPGVIKPLHVLWNEMLGFIFLALAVLLVRPLWRGYRDLNGEFENIVKFSLAAILFLVMLFFGLQGFWKARRISKS